MSGVPFWTLLVLGSLWAGTALWVQFPNARWIVFILALAVLAVVILRLCTPWGWVGLALVAAVVAAWYLSLRPQQDLDWAPDVAHSVSGEVRGDIVALHNIRAFRWSDPETAEARWQDRQVDLSRLEGADMITSVWGNPKIAHLLVSFRFTDQPPVTFSVEIRKERTEAYSTVGGFFRQFELALIAANEDDIVRLRTTYRGEEVRLYPLTLTPAQLRALFLRYVELGNDLNRAPRFYNTVTSNCTTVVWQLAKVLSPDLPVSRSLLLSGYLPEYLDRFGVLAGEGNLEDKRARALITPRARAMPDGADFSAWIRGDGAP